MAMTSEFLQSSVVFLSAAVVAVPIAQRLGLGSVLGYLIAGVLIGPWGLGLISDVDAILHFAELGVVLLLFLIGLELNPKKLWQMRGPILGLGGAQVIVTTAVIGSIVSLFGLSMQVSLVIGMGLALSSTAIALEVIEEQGQAGTETGGFFNYPGSRTPNQCFGFCKIDISQHGIRGGYSSGRRIRHK